MYVDADEIELRRRSYHQRVVELLCDLERLTLPSHAAEEIIVRSPYFLPYQGRNDRDLQMLFGKAVCRIMSGVAPPAARLATSPEPGEAVRVGIACGQFWSHSVWKTNLRGWLSQLDKQRFQLFGYYTGTKQDEETATAERQFLRFVQGPKTILSWRDTILADNLHVLIYPEIGMDGTVAKLAALRLAPVQCTTWGHPETSGYPTIDFYLSSDLMEPDDGQSHYSERLIRLPNLSVYYEPLPSSRPFPIARQALGLHSESIVFWCGQNLCKYLPQHDAVYPMIARAVPRAQFVFIDLGEAKPATDIFRNRLAQVFSDRGLNVAQHCVMLPVAPYFQYISAMGLADITLDSIEWSGCNTTFDSLSHSLPIVSMPGRFMRGRHTTAMLTMMGMEDTVAASMDDYVSIAARLANDLNWRRSIREKITVAKQRVYRDRYCVAALEKFLDERARSTRVALTPY